MKPEKNNYSLLFTRLAFGLSIMLVHGLFKLHMLGSPAVHSFPDPLGIGSSMSFYLIFFAEFICAILLVLGLFTRFAALVLSIGMLVIAFKVHLHDGYSPQFIVGLSPEHPLLYTPFKEYSLLYAYAFIPFIFTGAGNLSLDHLIRNKR